MMQIALLKLRSVFQGFMTEAAVEDVSPRIIYVSRSAFVQAVVTPFCTFDMFESCRADGFRSVTNESILIQALEKAVGSRNLHVRQSC